MNDDRVETQRISVVFGPEMPDWGSWEWVGQDVHRELARYCSTATFGWDALPEPPPDVLCVVKHPLPLELYRRIPSKTRVVYAPVDYYGSVAEIDADVSWLRRCARIVVHCERLRKYFASYAPVEYLDHHVKYVGTPAIEHTTDGPILWVGVRSNLPPLIDWLRQHTLPRNLIVLTNPEDLAQPLSAELFGFPERSAVKVEAWSLPRHLHWLSHASAALDTGRQNLRIDARGNRTTFLLDAEDRQIGRRYPDGSAVTMAYDPVANRTLLRDATGRYTSAYDARSQMTVAVTPAAQRNTYAYDAIRQRVLMIAPTGGRFTYGYDAAQRITRVVNRVALPEILAARNGERTRVMGSSQPAELPLRGAYHVGVCVERNERRTCV